MSEKTGINVSKMEIIDEPDVAKCGQLCTELVNSGKASVMMKGLVGTSDYMRAVFEQGKGT